jgi:GH15 family glucan-1,4-alpha-glucosidase
MSTKLEDYAMIGDGQTMALVSRSGAIDWLCLPRFDSDACFATLLGDDANGSWQIAPQAEPTEIRRRYCGDTLVLETEFRTAGGLVQVLDFMPIRSGKDAAVIRMVTGIEGEVAMRSTLAARFDYGTVSPWYADGMDGAIIGKVGPDLVVLRADVPLTRERATVTADFRVKTGDRFAFSMQHDGSTSEPPPPLDAERLLGDTKAWWLDWIKAFDKPTEWPDLVKRSLIVLKALTYFPTGGIVAAGTMGLPEKPGGQMNWDYRYCWLRDSTFTLTALLNAGFQEEAQKWLHWLLRAVAGGPERIRIAYRVDGGRHLYEWEADWLPGWEGSRPVRVGNGAARQRQLDIFGEVIDSTHLAERAGLERSDWEGTIERQLVQHVAKTWREPDQGLWEARGRPKHYVYSKAMAWVAVDRFLKMEGARAHCEPELRAALERLHGEMHAEICAQGWSQKRGSFVAHYATRRLDASLLLLPLVGFLPIDDPRITATIAACEAELMEGGFVRRHKAPAFGTEEGSFIACSCWLANCMVLQGRHDEARALLARIAGIANEVGLLSEEYHVREGRLLGNMPQALSHLSFINAALNLSGPVLQRGGG